MDYEFARAQFRVSGDVTSSLLRQALTLIELNYNMSAFLRVDRSRSDWEITAFTLDSLSLRISESIRPRSGRRRRIVRDLDDQNQAVAENMGFLTDYFGALIGDPALELRVLRAFPSGSISIDTGGLGDPLKEIVTKLWTRKERAEAHRHAGEMNWREERDSDQEYRHREQKHILDSMVQINELRKSGAITQQSANLMIAQLMPVEDAVNRQLQSSDIEYVDDSLQLEK